MAGGKKWLLKSEPSVYSFADLRREGSTKWNGVRNYTARNFLQAMAQGDEFFFYHSNAGKEIVGTGKVIKTAEPDTMVEQDERTKDGRNPWVVVTVAPGEKLERPVTLAAMREVAALKEMALFKYARLSVQPVTAAEWRTILKLSAGAT